jgi:histone H3/H4
MAKKIDHRKQELISLITSTDDALQIKTIAQLVKKIDELQAQEEKLAALQESVTELTQQIADELNAFQESQPAKPKSNRGRKPKVK